MSIKNPYKDIQGSAAKDYFNEGVKAAVQYLEGLCPNVSHESIHFECKRVNCPDCMKQIHEELGQ